MNKPVFVRKNVLGCGLLAIASLWLTSCGSSDVECEIDAVFTDFRNSDGLNRETNIARRDGFTAKAAIHPAQVAIINRCFTPTDAERLWAERVIAAFDANTSGAVQIDGVMLDAPHLTQARRIMTAFQSNQS